MNRRMFLQQAGGGALAAASAAMVTVRAADGAAPAAAPPAVPARKYRVAVIGRTGRGNYGHEVDAAWRAIPNAEVVAVADADAKGLAAAAKRLKVTQAFADYREMLDKVRPDIVAIAPRWIDQHAEMAVAAAERGIHIFIEKPLCRSPAEADRILAACDKAGVRLAVAHPTRYSPRVEAVRRIIAEGRIGKVLEYRARGKEDSRGGAEDLWVLGTHMFDLTHALAGRPDWCFASVTQGGRPITKADVVDGPEGIGPIAGDAVRAMYGLPDGSTLYFNSLRKAGAGKVPRYGLWIYGTAGVIEIQEGMMPAVKVLLDPSWSAPRSGIAWQDVTSAGIAQSEPLTDPSASTRHTRVIQDLLACIEEKREPSGGIRANRDAVEMITAVFESQRLGRSVTLPLETRVNPLTLLG